jgi:aerobic-type carbon monoxide dehydrogenase small subunit (CoxS/CutS family)
VSPTSEINDAMSGNVCRCGVGKSTRRPHNAIISWFHVASSTRRLL